MSAINLDCEPKSDLVRVILDASAHPMQRGFARYTLVARKARLQGRISAALRWEGAAEAAYRSLPRKLRW